MSGLSIDDGGLPGLPTGSVAGLEIAVDDLTGNSRLDVLNNLQIVDAVDGSATSGLGSVEHHQSGAG